MTKQEIEDLKNRIARERLDNVRMAKKGPYIPKDFANKGDIFKTDAESWEFENKESLAKLAGYFVFVALGFFLGACFIIGLSS